MNSYRERMYGRGSGLQAEYDVYGRLKVNGYRIIPFGQGTWDSAFADAIRRTNSLLRWLPDFLAYKQGRGYLYLIDAKGGKKHNETGRHDVEIASLEMMNVLQSLDAIHRAV